MAARNDPFATASGRRTLRRQQRQKAIELFGIDPDAPIREDLLTPENARVIRKAQWHAGCAAMAALGHR